jgi:hypothetical protein
MAITFTAAIDTADNGTWTDISADVLTLHWELGLRQPHDSLAEPGWARVSVRSPQRAYSPELNALRPGLRLRIASDDGTTQRTHFTGQIARIEPLPGDQGPRTATIHAVDALTGLEQATVRLPPQSSVTADMIIARVLDRAALRPAVLAGRWLLGRADHAELGQHTRLPERVLPHELETGKTVFAYVGDTWAEGIPAADALRAVVEAERGRLFIDRDGRLVFYNRHHLLRQIAPLAVFQNDWDALTYTYGADIISRVQVRLRPRRVGTAGALLWALTEPQRIRARASWTVTARFRDDQGQPAGALALETPRPGLDYQAVSVIDGADLTQQVEVIVRRADFSAALIEVRSRAAVEVDCWLQLRGTPLLQADPLLVEAFSPGAEAFYGPGVLNYDLPALGSLAQAEALARFELARRRQPVGCVRQITLHTARHAPHALAGTLFDRIRVQETQTGHAADYFIVREAHEVEQGGYRHRVTWTLERADAGAFWTLGHSRLAQQTTLAY